MRVTVRQPPRTMVVVLVVLVVLGGLLVGGVIATVTRPPHGATRQQVVVRATAPPRAPQPAQIATTIPSAVSTPAPTAVPTAPPAAAVAAAPAIVRNGAWRISEANVQVGTIVWSGSETAAGQSAMALDVHKESVGGRPVSACERRTTLHATVPAAPSNISVSYREVNCSGATSNGEMRIVGASPDGRSFSGSFWSDGAKLGDFTAQRTP